MLNHDVDTLTKQLEGIRLEQANAIERLKKINEVETDTLIELSEARAKALRRRYRYCPYKEGDILRINNRIRDEYGIVGRVRKVCDTRVTICNSGTGNNYEIAWWNFVLVKPTTGARQGKRRTRS